MRKSFFFAAFFLFAISISSQAQTAEDALAKANQKYLDIAKWADDNVSEVTKAKSAYKVSFGVWSQAVEENSPRKEEFYQLQKAASETYFRTLAAQPEVIAAKKALALARQNAIAENSNN